VRLPDVHDKATRSRNMAAIRAKNTKPELLVRQALHGAGLRFRLHRNDLPGKPDIVLPKHQTVIFVHGCFWHGHACEKFRWPKDNADFWRDKINRNIQRDVKAQAELAKAGWRCIVLWDCELKQGDTMKRLIGELGA
jgi:DNA mismatch endonuclease, patch repair protein